MNTIFPSFDFKTNTEVVTFIIEGDFRSGTQFEIFKMTYNSFYHHVNSINLDLTKVIYMDSDTMEFIFNHKGSKIMPLDSKVTERYLDYVNSRHEVEVK